MRTREEKITHIGMRILTLILALGVWAANMAFAEGAGEDSTSKDGGKEKVSFVLTSGVSAYLEDPTPIKEETSAYLADPTPIREEETGKKNTLNMKTQAEEAVRTAAEEAAAQEAARKAAEEAALQDFFNHFAVTTIDEASGFLYIREEPTSASEWVGKLYPGGTGTILEVDEEWTQIESGEVVGWVKNDYIMNGEEAHEYAKDFATRIATVDADVLLVRSEMSKEGEVLTEVFKGERYLVQNHDREWLAIRSMDGVEGYISSEYVTFDYFFEEAISKEEELEAIRLEQERIAAEEAAARAAWEAAEAARIAEERRIAEAEEAARRAAEEAAAWAAWEAEEAARQAAEEAARQAAEEAARQAAEAQANNATYATEDEIYIMAAMLEVEAGGNYEGCLAVANCILNRVKSPLFPNSIVEVIYQKSQFATGATFDYYLSVGPHPNCIQAAWDAVNGANNMGDYLFFRSARTANYDAYSSWVNIGGNVFYQR